MTVRFQAFCCRSLSCCAIHVVPYTRPRAHQREKSQRQLYGQAYCIYLSTGALLSVYVAAIGEHLDYIIVGR